MSNTAYQPGWRTNSSGLLVVSDQIRRRSPPLATTNAMAWRVPCGGQGSHARDQLLLAAVERDLAGHRAEHAAHVLERLPHRLGRLAHPRVVHPERPLGLRHHQLGVREDGLAGPGAQAVDVVAVEMGEDDGVDLLGGVAGRRKFSCQLPVPGAPISPLPASIMTSREPLLITVVVNGMVSVSVGWKAAASAPLHLGQGRVADKTFGERATAAPSLTSVTSISPTMSR